MNIRFTFASASKVVSLATLVLAAPSAFAQSAAPPPAAAPPAAAPPPAAASTSASQPTATATVEASVGTSARTAEPTPAPIVVPAPPRREPPSDDAERRLVVFTDGPSPRLVAWGDRTVRGPLELEVRFRNANPLCYEYSTNVAASRVAASDQPLPERVPGIGAFGATSSANFTSLEEAQTALNNSETELDEMLNALRIQVSLDDVWAACDGGGDFLSQRTRVESAARIAAQRLAPTGAWRQVLESAEAVALGAKRLSRELETGEHDAAQEVEARKATLTDAERKEQAVRTSRRGDADDASRELAGAQRKLREGELILNRHRRGGDLGRAAERLSARVQQALETLSADIGDINRARSLLARSPTAIRRRFGPGEKVAVIIERSRLERGARVEGRGPQLFEVPAYETLHPMIMDLSIGPVLGIGHNTTRYETVWSPKDAEDPHSAYRVVRTEQGLPLDAMLSLSAYIWGRRYLDNVVVDPMQFVPRPMIAMSLSHPTKILYAGLQIDPIQYIDISGGVKIANEQKLIGPQPTERALIDDQGDPQPPVTRDQIRVSGFISVTVSANLLYSWIKNGL